MKHFKSVFCIFLLFYMLFIASPQMTNAKMIRNTYSVSRHIIVNGRIGENFTEYQPKDKDDKITVVVDASQLENERLPQTGSYLNKYQRYAGFYLISLVILVFFWKRKFCDNDTR